MKKQSFDEEDIKVNRRSTDKIHFESTLIQQIADGIDFLRDESKIILKELDLNVVDDFDIEEFGRDTINQIDDLVDDISKFKSEILNSDDVPDFIKDSSNDFKKALNRDEVYLRRAERKLNKINSADDVTGYFKINVRVIDLCNKAIDVNYKNSRAYYIKALALINLEKYDEAIQELVKCLALDEDNLDAWCAIGDANRCDSKFDDALSIYDKVLSIDEKYAGALKGKAFAYYELKDYKKANEFFKKASAIEVLDDESQEIWDACLNNLN